MSLDDHILQIRKRWFIWLKEEKGYSHNTIMAYEGDFKNFLSFLSLSIEEVITTKTIENLSLQDFRSWLTYRRRNKLSSSSNARALSSIKSFFCYIDRYYNIKNQEIFCLSIPILRKNLPKTLREEQIYDMLDYMNKEYGEVWLVNRDITILLLLYGCGLRISEALGLKIGDLTENDLKIIGKGRKERRVPLLEIIKHFIKQYILSCPFLENQKSDQYLFLGVRGKKLHRTYYSNHIQKLRRLLNFPENVTPHSFRHSFATHLFMNKADIRVIQELLGHESLSTTQVYTHLDQNSMINIYKNFHPLCSSPDCKNEEI